MSDLVLFQVRNNEEYLVAKVAAEAGVAINKFCPFTDEQRLCGSWCPHFTLYKHNDVGLTCSGQPIVLKLKEGS